MPRHKAPNWQEVRDLAAQVENGAPLTLNAKVIALLRRAAPTVGISAEQAKTSLRTVRGASALLRKIRGRIRNGSRRFSRTILRMYQLREVGDLEGARKQLRDLLAVEEAPHRRWVAEGQLEELDDLEAQTRKTPGKVKARKAKTSKAPAKPVALNSKGHRKNAAKRS